MSSVSCVGQLPKRIKSILSRRMSWRSCAGARITPQWGLHCANTDDKKDRGFGRGRHRDVVPARSMHESCAARETEIGPSHGHQAPGARVCCVLASVSEAVASEDLGAPLLPALLLPPATLSSSPPLTFPSPPPTPPRHPERWRSLSAAVRSRLRPRRRDRGPHYRSDLVSPPGILRDCPMIKEVIDTEARVALEDFEGRMLRDHVRSHHAPEEKDRPVFVGQKAGGKRQRLIQDARRSNEYFKLLPLRAAGFDGGSGHDDTR